MKNKNTLTLELFNVVEKGQSQEPVFIDSHGVFVDSTAVYAIKDIKKHLKNLKLSGNVNEICSTTDEWLAYFHENDVLFDNYNKS